MNQLHLYIAYKNYSSWSLRPWIALKVAGINFAETILPFDHSDALTQFSLQHNIPAQVPVLVADGQVIWDSLAILEYLAERYPAAELWPRNPKLRALARSAAAEMHSSFSALRSQCPMNCRTQRRIAVNEAIQTELTRLAAIWELFEQADKPAGTFLAGPFSNVDAMYAPIMWRVRNYGLSVSPAFERWSDTMLALPAMQEWLAAAKAEANDWVLPQYED